MSAYPNPFSNKVHFEFNVEASTNVKLEIVSLTGQKVATLYNGMAKEGKDYHLELETEKLAQGFYIYRFQTSNYVETKILVLNR